MSKQSDLISVSQGAAGDPLFVDAANNRVGVGETTPLGHLHVKSEDTGVSSVSAQGDLLVLEGTESGLSILNSTSGAGYINFGDSDDNDIGMVVYDHSSNSMRFWANAAERARIDASGTLMVGTTTDITAGGAGLQLKNSLGHHGRMDFGKTFDGNVNGLTFNHLLSRVGSIQYNNTSTSYNTSSDYRLKENVVPLAGAADRLMQIPVCRFNFIADPDTTVDGFLAHEVQTFVPECVTGEKDQVETVEVTDEDGNVIGTEERPVYQGIDQSKLVPLLTAALQEALQKIDALETRISALETN